ncbi:MAG: hypothetical protein HY360_12975 [Verrucomicrobia bacterium]|nr:hypothetical protein [Verrucomicrobiota bacterium]
MKVVSEPKTLFAGTIAVAVLLVFRASWMCAAVETRNLICNGDFEEAGASPPGWETEASEGESFSLVTDALTGNRALKISMPVVGNATVTSQPFAVTAGEDYLLTFWYRADGMSAKGGNYDGCAAGCWIVWQDPEEKELGRTLSNLPYGPVPDYRASTFTATAPEGAASAFLKYGVNVGQDYKGPATSLFIDQVRWMKLSKGSIPADAPKWEYLSRMLCSGLKFVADREAAQGQAIVAEVGKANKNSLLTWGQYTSEQPVGECLAVFRLKVKDNTRKEPVASLGVTGHGSLNYGLSSGKTLLATDFKKPGVYQDFAVRFVRPEEGILEFFVQYLGATDLSFDKTTVIHLATFATDKEQAAIWLGE